MARRSDDEFRSSFEQGKSDGRNNIPNIDMYILALQRDERARLTSAYADRIWDIAQQQGARLGRQFRDDVGALVVERREFLATEKDREDRLNELRAKAEAFEAAHASAPPTAMGGPGAAVNGVPQHLVDEIAQVRLAKEEAHKARVGREAAIENRREVWTEQAREVWHSTRAEASAYWAANAEHYRNWGAAISSAPKLEPELPDWTTAEYLHEKA